MNNFIAKHKMFILLVIALITLLVGVCLSCTNDGVGISQSVNSQIESIPQDQPPTTDDQLLPEEENEMEEEIQPGDDYEDEEYEEEEDDPSDAREASATVRITTVFFWVDQNSFDPEIAYKGSTYQSTDGATISLKQVYADISLSAYDTENGDSGEWDSLSEEVDEETRELELSVYTYNENTLGFEVNLSYEHDDYGFEGTVYEMPEYLKGDEYEVDELTSGTEFSHTSVSVENGGIFEISCYVLVEPVYEGLTFDANGGTFVGMTDGNTKESWHVFYELYEGSSVEPVRAGYKFSKWTAGQVGGSERWINYKNKKVYAQWVANNTQITLDKNHSGGTSESKTVTYDSVVSNVTPPKRTGYKFLGYYTATSGGTQIFNAGGNVVKSVSGYTDSSGKWKKDLGANGELTLYAQWEQIRVKIGFYDGKEFKGNFDVGFTDQLSLPAWAPTSKTGYTFLGFYTAQTGGTQIFKSDGSVKTGVSGYTDANGKLIKEADFNLYAVWSENTYTITFNSNGGSGIMASMTGIKYTQQVTLSQNTFARKGYTFSGWATSADGSKVYDDGQTVASLTGVDGDTINLYAVWSENTYTINFNANGGSGNMSSLTIDFTKSKPLTKNAFTRKYYLFTGWNTKSDGKGTLYKDNASISGSVGDITLYAQWEETWASAATKASGTGKKEDPYIIDSKEDLAWIAAKNIAHEESFADTYFKQTVNIDLSGGIWLPIGSEDVPFQGKYDGNGYVITNLNTSNVQNASGQYLYSYAGLFGMVGSRSTKTDAEVKNVNIFNSVIYGHSYVGIVAGTVQKAKITSCQTSGSINSSGSHCGGIAGSIGSDTSLSVINKCYSTASILGNENCGGIVGSLGSGKVISCGFEGKNLTGTTNAGILVGNASGGTNSTISDCFANVTFSANFYNGSATIGSCLYSISTTKKYYYDGNFSNWVILNGKPLPSGFAWVANATTTAKNTVISDYTKVS